MTTSAEQQIARWTRIVNAGELVTLTDDAQLHVYGAHPHGGYRRLTITPDPAGGLPHVGQLRGGPTNLHGWLSSDLRGDWKDYDPDAPPEPTEDQERGVGATGC